MRVSEKTLNSKIFDDEEFLRLLKSSQNLYLSSCRLKIFPSILRFRGLTYVDLSNSIVQKDVFASLPETVTSLVAKHCHLKKLPDCYHLINLDVRNNEIIDIIPSKMFSKLEHLNIRENKISTIEYDRKLFPSLQKLLCGSNECQYISFVVIGEKIENKINLEIFPETSLLLPPKTCLGEKDKLKSYVESPEKYVENSELGISALNWLLDDGKKQSKSFDLSEKNLLFKSLDFGNLQEKLKCNCLSHVRYLNLSELSLTAIPSLQHLKLR